MGNQINDPDDYMTRKDVTSILIQHDIMKAEKRARQKYQDYDEVAGTFLKILDGNPGLQQKFWQEVVETGDIENCAESAYIHGQALRKVQGSSESSQQGYEEKDVSQMSDEEWGKLSQEERDKLSGIE